MRIKSIRATQPPTPGSPADWRTQLGQIVVEVQTDDGLTGIGVGGGGAASIHVIQTVLQELLVGCDPTDVEQLHREMLAHTSFYGRKGLVVMAISGVDIALWDLRGKVQATSVARLLNPDVDSTRPIPTYATVFDDADAHAAIETGHAAIKLHVERFGDRPQPAEIADLVASVRDRTSATTMLMIDAFARWNIETTLRVAEAIAPHNVAWLEEPLPPDDLAGYATLAAESPVPIAGGEHEYTADGFRQLAQQRLHTILQPDVNWCGGLTTLVEIYAIAAVAGLRVCPHRGSEPFALPAIAAIDPQPLAESPRKWFNGLEGAPRIEDGIVRVSDEPGFGIAVDESIWQR